MWQTGVDRGWGAGDTGVRRRYRHEAPPGMRRQGRISDDGEVAMKTRVQWLRSPAAIKAHAAFLLLIV